MIEVKKVDMNIARLVRLMNQEKINFDTALQRGDVWDNKRKSILIHSVLLEWPLPIFFLNQIGEKEYDSIEGKQRSKTFDEFIKGDFRLNVNTPPVLDDNGDEISVAKRKFSELPISLQERITGYGLTVYCFNNASNDEMREFFRRINNGKPVTATEITRTQIKSRSTFQILAKHNAIENILSTPKKKKGIGEDLVSHMWCMCYSGSDSLLNKDIGPILNQTEVTQEQNNEMIKILDYMVTLLILVGDDKKILYKIKKSTTHFISLCYMAFFAIRKGMTNDEFANKAKILFSCEGTKATNSDEYNGAIEGGAKAEKVRTRKREVEKALE